MKRKFSCSKLIKEKWSEYFDSVSSKNEFQYGGEDHQEKQSNQFDKVEV